MTQWQESKERNFLYDFKSLKRRGAGAGGGEPELEAGSRSSDKSVNFS